MKRRDFINWVGLGLIGSSLPVAIAACSSQTTSTSGDWQTVGTSAELNKTGQLLAKNSPAGPVLVVGTSAANLTAVNPTCPHSGCTVGWQAEAKKFACPCHGSEFGIDGKVQRGPATEALKTYAAKIEGNSVVVKPT